MENLPNKHHYLPKFYLKEWAGPDDRICCFSKPYLEKVVPKRRYPSQTGYIHRLYAIEGLPEAQAVEFESTFLSPVDNHAADAMRTMKANHQNLVIASEQRLAWARFLQSLMIRMPADIAQIKQHVKGEWIAQLPGVSEAYEAARTDEEPDTVLEFIQQSEEPLFEVGALGIIKRIIGHNVFATMVAALHWSILTVDRSDFTLLTSDRPIVYTPYLQGHDTHIMLPVGPNEIFLAVYEADYADAFRDTSDTALVTILNTAVVENADNSVIGVDDKQLRFVQNRMGKSRSPSLIDRIHQKRMLRKINGPQSDP